MVSTSSLGSQFINLISPFLDYIYIIAEFWEKVKYLSAIIQIFEVGPPGFEPGTHGLLVERPSTALELLNSCFLSVFFTPSPQGRRSNLLS